MDRMGFHEGTERKNRISYFMDSYQRAINVRHGFLKDLNITALCSAFRTRTFFQFLLALGDQGLVVKAKRPVGIMVLIGIVSTSFSHVIAR